MSNDTKESDSLDLAGIGRVAEAIPPEVYIRTSEAVLNIFEKLVAPLTEASSGFGRYIRQWFDSKIEIEKALAVLALERAVEKAKSCGKPLKIPSHPKSFIKILDEAGKEFDPVLRQMWTNLLASQFTEDDCRPHFISLLSQMSPLEARLLVSLKSIDEIDRGNGGMATPRDPRYEGWLRDTFDLEVKLWDLSCTILYEFGLVRVGPISKLQREQMGSASAVILTRTKLGDAFIEFVTD